MEGKVCGKAKKFLLAFFRVGGGFGFSLFFSGEEGKGSSEIFVLAVEIFIPWTLSADTRCQVTYICKLSIQLAISFTECAIVKVYGNAVVPA